MSDLNDLVLALECQRTRFMLVVVEEVACFRNLFLGLICGGGAGLPSSRKLAKIT